MRDDLLTLQEAAAYLKQSPGWLQKRVNRGGPANIKLGKQRYYTREALDAYIESCWLKA
jgi:excisionase family DNA binding protein